MSAYVCPNCGQELAAAGKGVQCPRCGQAVPLPDAPSTMEALTPEPLPLDPPPQAAAAKDLTVALEAAAENTPPPGTHPPAAAPGQASVADTTRAWSGPAGPEGNSVLPPSAAVAQELLDFLTPPQQPDEIGRLGIYRVLRVLGIGGMGVVFQAEDSLLRRPVALKVMLPAVAARASSRERFRREAQATAAIKHDHIVTIYQVGEDRGIPFLAMEFIEGEGLDERLKRDSRLPVAEVLRIGLETAEGLSAAHQRGLIHRDVKPANLRLEAPRGRVKVLDFGLARVAAEDSYLTQPGLILGTPAYMAPEQARGLPVDQRSDLFSLGCVLYRLCTGRPPFVGSDMLAVLTALALEQPQPVRELNAAVPAPLADLVMRLLSKDPKDRPPTARAVADALAAMQTSLLSPQRPAAPEPVAPQLLEPGDILNFDESQLLLPEQYALPQAPSQPAAPGAGAPEDAGKLILRLPGDRLEELAGETLGRYAIGSVLGRAFYGVVFRAQDNRNGQVVALRILPPEFPRNDAETQRFIQAMRAVMPVRHPNLVELYGAGKTGPYCWIATEYVEGESLAEITQRFSDSGKFDWKFALRVAVHIARALQATSQYRILHRNITPQNVLVRTKDHVAKLNDLMLQRALKRSLLERSTLEDKLLAEMAYLAPEQADSGSSYVDHLCDLYSLGAVTYALLTGEPPFLGDTLEETLAALRTSAPKRPRKYNRLIPRPFELAVLKMLARHQEDRYQSPSELLADLERIAGANRVKV